MLMMIVRMTGRSGERRNEEDYNHKWKRQKQDKYFVSILYLFVRNENAKIEFQISRQHY